MRLIEWERENDKESFLSDPDFPGMRYVYLDQADSMLWGLEDYCVTSVAHGLVWLYRK